MNYTLLSEVAYSPTASPLLWYEDIFFDLAEDANFNDPGEALIFLKRGLVHNLRYNHGNNALKFLTKIADWHLTHEEFDRRLQIFSILLHNEPKNIWLYNNLALSAQEAQLFDISAQAAQRGLDLIKLQGDSEKLSAQLEQILTESRTQRRSVNKIAKISSVLIEDMHTTLNLDFDSTPLHPLETLCQELIPELDALPVKRPLTYLDVDLPDRELILKELLEFIPELKQADYAPEKKAKKKYLRH